MTGVKGRTAHCHRCIYSWRIRRAERPKVCPRCKSRLWNVPKIRPVRLGNGLGIEEVLGPHRVNLYRIAHRHGATDFLVFGSVRRQEATAESDVDLLFRWKHPGTKSLLDRVSLVSEIEKELGRSVDLVHEEDLHWAIRPKVTAEAVPL